MSIHDARSGLADLDLDHNGFEFATLKSEAWDPATDKLDKSVYARELIKLVCSRMKPKMMAILSIVRRGRSRNPLLFAHNDFNFDYGPTRVREVMGDMADDLLRRRFAIVQTWQPVGSPIKRNPLAFCDARTVDVGDLIRDQGAFVLSHNTDHRWYYFSDMQPAEIVLFKTFDSMQDGRSRFAPHASFHHPDTPVDAPVRESVESRSVVFF